MGRCAKHCAVDTAGGVAIEAIRRYRRPGLGCRSTPSLTGWVAVRLRARPGVGLEFPFLSPWPRPLYVPIAVHSGAYGATPSRRVNIPRPGWRHTTARRLRTTARSAAWGATPAEERRLKPCSGGFRGAELKIRKGRSRSGAAAGPCGSRRRSGARRRAQRWRSSTRGSGGVARTGGTSSRGPWPNARQWSAWRASARRRPTRDAAGREALEGPEPGSPVRGVAHDEDATRLQGRRTRRRGDRSRCRLQRPGLPRLRRAQRAGRRTRGGSFRLDLQPVRHAALEAGQRRHQRQEEDGRLSGGPCRRREPGRDAGCPANARNRDGRAAGARTQRPRRACKPRRRRPCRRKHAVLAEAGSPTGGRRQPLRASLGVAAVIKSASRSKTARQPLVTQSPASDEDLDAAARAPVSWRGTPMQHHARQARAVSTWRSAGLMAGLLRPTGHRIRPAGAGVDGRDW